MTNSRPSNNTVTDTYNGSALCSDHGIDTVRFRWRPGNEAYRDFRRRPGGTFEGARGERFVQTELGRVGCYPEGMAYFEGRAAALCEGSPDEHRLATVHELPSAERVAHRIIRDSGCPVPEEPARLGRIDLASEMAFQRGAEGQAFLHALSALDVPWCKSRTDGRKGSGIETVSFHGTRGKTIYLRAYDKGVESGTNPPGRRIRVERQKRYRKEREMTVTMAQSANLHSMFLGREFAKLADLPMATVCDVPEALNVLWERCESSRQMEYLAGYLVVGQYLDYDRQTIWRRESALRALGIYVDPAQIERVEVPVGRYLHALSAAWAA